MTIRSQGRRKSNFPADTGIPSDATLDFVSGSTNYKITLADFLSALSVTGTIVQEGAATGTPVLDVQGAINNIRNLETDENSGIAFSVSAENGVYAKLDAQSTGAGVPVLDTDNTIRRILAGSGIAVASSNGDIVVSTTAIPGASRVVVVNVLADFPSPVGGVIPLAANTIYFLQDIVDIGVNTFSLAANTVMTGFSFAVTGITSSATGTLFLNSGTFTNEISRMRVTAPNCTIFGLSSPIVGANLFISEVSVLSCVSVSDISACSAFRADGISSASCSANAFIFSGTCTTVIMTNILVADWTGVLFELDSAIFDNFSIETAQVTSTSGSNKVIEGQVSSANISSGSLATLRGIIVSGSFTDSVTIFPTDIRWDFQGNNFASDSSTDALLSMQANATETAIVVAGTPVLVAGTWVVEIDDKMTGTVGGRVTYDAQRDVDIAITASLTVSPVSGTNQVIGVFVAVNGSTVANSKRTATVSSTSSSSITLPWSLVLSTTDFVEIFVSNDTTTNNVVVTSAILRAD